MERKKNFDLLRVLCMICVMLLHIGDDYFYLRDGEPMYYYTLSNFCLALTLFGVPCFIMLSGGFLLSNKRNRDFKNFYKKSFRKLGLPALIMSLLYVLYNIVKIYYHRGIGIEVTDTPMTYLKEWMVGLPFYHMWYMYMFLTIYLLVPILLRAKEQMTWNEWRNFAIVSMAASMIMEKTTEFEVQWGLKGILFLSYFLMGDVIKTYYENHKDRKTGQYIVFGCLILFAFFLYREYVVRSGTDPIIYYSKNFSAFVVIASILIFAGFTNVNVKGNWPRIGEKTYYMYLVHAGVIDVTYNIIPERGNPIFIIPFMFLVTFVGSYFISSIVMNVEKRMKW